MFIRASEGDDPPVYYCEFGTPLFEVRYRHFNKLLAGAMDRYVEHVEWCASKASAEEEIKTRD
jgi:hypothetical protein